MISSADAALLLSKFETEATLLKVTLALSGQSIYIALKARVGGFTEGEHLSLLTEAEDISIVSLKGCRFEYGDERAAPEFLQEWAARRFEGTLTILFPSNERLSLRALRSEIPSAAA